MAPDLFVVNGLRHKYRLVIDKMSTSHTAVVLHFAGRYTRPRVTS